MKLVTTLPTHIREQLIGYVEHGKRPEDFLLYVLQNDLWSAVARCTPEEFACLPRLLTYLFYNAPFLSLGSRSKVEEWLSSEWRNSSLHADVASLDSSPMLPDLVGIAAPADISQRVSEILSRNFGYYRTRFHCVVDDMLRVLLKASGLTEVDIDFFERSNSEQHIPAVMASHRRIREILTGCLDHDLDDLATNAALHRIRNRGPRRLALEEVGEDRAEQIILDHGGTLILPRGLSQRPYKVGTPRIYVDGTASDAEMERLLVGIFTKGSDENLQD
jgi:hypothetical protein